MAAARARFVALKMNGVLPSPPEAAITRSVSFSAKAPTSGSKSLTGRSTRVAPTDDVSSPKKLSEKSGTQRFGAKDRSGTRVLKRTLTEKEIAMRRHFSSLDGTDPDDMLLQAEVRATNFMKPSNAPGGTFDRIFRRAATLKLNQAEMPREIIMPLTERLDVAACLVHQGVARTAISSMEWHSPLSRAAFRMRRSFTCRTSLRLAFIGLTVIILWEPPTTWGVAEAAPPGWLACSAVELVCALVFFTDLSLQLICQRPHRFLRSTSSCNYAVLVLLISFDALAALFITAANGGSSYPARVSRFARPLLLPFLSRTCEHMAVSILRSLPSLTDFALLILVSLIFFTLLGLSFFGRDNEAAASMNSSLAVDHAAQTGIFMLNSDWLPPTTNATDSIVLYLQQPLSSMTALFLHLMIALVSADNYPSILYAAYDCEELGCGDVGGSVFFIIYLVIGHIVLMTVAIALVFETYKRQHGFLILSERVDERQALLAAFNVLTTGMEQSCKKGRHRLSKVTFKQLMLKVNSATTESSVRLAFRLLDTDESADIDVHEFVKLSSVLALQVPTQGEAEIEARPWMAWRSESLQCIVEHSVFYAMCDALSLAYIILLLAISSGTGWSAYALSAFATADLCFVIFFTLELVLKVAGLSLEEFLTDVSNRIDLVVVPLCYSTYVIEALLQEPGGASSLRALRILRLLRVGRAIGRLFKVFGKVITSSRKTKVFLATLKRFGRVIGKSLGSRARRVSALTPSAGFGVHDMTIDILVCVLLRLQLRWLAC